MNLTTIPLWHMERCWQVNEKWSAPLLQRWWLHRWLEDGAHSNIRVGDFFTLGHSNQVGIISSKTIMCYQEENKPSDAPCHFQYDISGDIGGHWRRPMHEDMEAMHGGEQYFLFIPSATQLAEIATQLANDKLFDWAQELLVYYRDHPGESTHPGAIFGKWRREGCGIHPADIRISKAQGALCNIRDRCYAKGDENLEKEIQYVIGVLQGEKT